MMGFIVDYCKKIFIKKSLFEQYPWQPEWTEFLQGKVVFYQRLSTQEQQQFNQRVLQFLSSTGVEAGQFEVSDYDRLLVAASAIIPVWAFPKWQYLNLESVYLLPAAFNEKFECGQKDSIITGMVGQGPMSGKMALCKPSLYQGFANSRDKSNVGIHEFVHLIDMADGETDGYPERLKEHSYAIPWMDLVHQKTQAIDDGSSNINAYAATNRVEFFAVASEYFFERPIMLKRKHPKLYQSLQDIYQQDLAAIEQEASTIATARCPCGSGEPYLYCCQPKP